MSADPTSVATAFVEAINRQSRLDLSNLMTEDHTFVDSLGRTREGREAMIAGWEHYFAMFPDYEIRVERMLANDEVVAIFGSAFGTFAGKRGPVSENRIEMPAAWKAVIEDGKVRTWQVYADWTEGMKIIARETKG
jgi:hypothetical protein